jgi:DNA-binding MarR family transcriptional regulator
MSFSKKDLEHELVMAVREYGISNTLFRNVIANRIGINVTDMECLGLLFHKGIASPTELANYTGLSTGSTTAMLDRLEKAKLIVRKPNPTDRRGLLISVNKEGSKQIAPLFIKARKAQNELISSYSEKNLQMLTDFFKKFMEIYEEQRRNL